MLSIEERKQRNRESARRYYERHKSEEWFKQRSRESTKAYVAKYKNTEAYKTKASERKKRYYEANKGKLLQQMAEYAAANRTKRLEYYRQRYQRDKDVLSARDRVRRLENSAQIEAIKRLVRNTGLPYREITANHQGLIQTTTQFVILQRYLREKS